MKTFLKYTIEEQLEAVKEDGDNIRYIQNPSEDVCLEAVREDGYSIQYIQNPSEKVKLEAVRKYGCSIRCIHNPSEQVCFEAVNNDPCAIQYISQYYESVAQITDDEDYLALKPDKLEDIITLNGKKYKLIEE